MSTKSKNEGLNEPGSSFQFKHRNKFAFHGVVASLLLVLSYFSIVGTLESFDHAVAEFLSISYLLIPLIVGFGVQVSLFSYSRSLSKAMRQGSVSVTTSGGLSTASMIACCAHHLTDVVPFIGITALTLFLTAYQIVFIIIGLLSNIVGVLTILAFMQKHKLYNPRGFLANLMQLNIAKTRNFALILSLIVVIISFAWVGLVNQTAFVLPTKRSEQNGLAIEVTLLPFAVGDEVKFKLRFDTHSGDLNFDLTKVATLEDSNGTKYTPTGWSGSPPSGHHREGILAFPPLSNKASSIKLVLTGVYETNWIFEWSLSN
ncbi:MAG: hypothetical protein QXM52_02985 [Candidatus Bathyarchaeia archaeon]